ncbi:MAG TPA: hypothetical protein VF950_30590 [Planctomycetota bacterium]
MTTPPGDPAPPPPPPPKKRRWKKILGITGAVLFGLLLLAAILVPPIAGAVLRSKVPSVLGETLAADVTLQDASFSWSGRVLLKGLKVVPRGFREPLLEVDAVRADVALFSALSGSYVADVEVDAPRVFVERDGQGRFNYEAPPKPPSGASTSSGGSKSPLNVQAVLRVRGGDIRVREAGQETRFLALTVDARVDGLDRPIPWSLSLGDPAGGTIAAKGEYALEPGAGPARIDVQNLALANLAAVARAYGDPTLDLSGTLDASLQYSLNGLPAFSGQSWVKGKNVDVRHRGRAFAFESISFDHKGGLDAQGVGDHGLHLQAGKLLDLGVTAQVTKAGVTARLEIDVHLAETVAWLRTSGLLKADVAAEGTVSLRGTAGTAPLAWNLKTTSPRVTVTVDGKPVVIEGVSHESQGAIDDAGNGQASLSVFSGKALEAHLSADLAAIYKDPAVQATLDASSDLAELGRVLEKALGFKAGLALEGKSTLRAKAAYQARDARVDLVARTTDLAAVDASKKRTPLDKEILLDAGVAWNGTTSTATVDRLKLTSSFATAEGKGGATVGDVLTVRASTLTLDADLAGLASKLGAVLEKPPALAGKASLRAKAEGEAVSLDGTFSGVRFEGYGPLDATLKHEGLIDAKGDGWHSIVLKSGPVMQADLRAERKGGAVTMGFSAKADLGALAAALPGLIELKPGVILEGRAWISGDAGWKGEAATFNVKGELDGLAAVEKKTRTEIDKLATFAAAGAWDGTKKSLDLKTLTLRSALATADAKGGFTLTPLSVRESSFVFGADLTAIGSNLGLFIADAPKLAGRVDAKGSYGGDAYDVTATAAGVKVGANGPIDATLLQRGKLSLAPGGGLAIEAGELKSSAVDVILRGAIRKVRDPAREGELALEATVRPGELSKWIPDLGLAGEPIPLNATVSLKPNLITATGKTELKHLTITSKGIVKTARSRPATFDVQMKGDDLVAKLRSALVEWIEPTYAGKAGVEADLTYSPKGTSGVTKLVNLEVVDEKKNVVKEEAVTLTHDVGLAKGAFDIRKADVACGFLRGGLTGKVKNFDTEPAFEGIRGTFRFHPDKLGAVLKPFMPGTLSGAEEKTITIALDGASLRDAKGTVDVDIPRYTHTGVTVSGKANLAVDKGLMKTTSPLAVNQGRTDLTASIDLREAKDKPVSTVDFKAKEVDANADMAPFLSSINPIFHTVNGAVAGKSTADFRLTWTGPLDPATKDWEKAAAPALRGNGTLAVKDLVITGSPAVALIMQALGEGNDLRGELLGTDIRVENGRCAYSNMTLRLARYELRFTGWVAFDKTMELEVEMPLTPAMRKRYPNLERYTGQTIKVPLRGKASSPRLDLERVIENLIKDALPGLLEDALKKLLERKNKDK